MESGDDGWKSFHQAILKEKQVLLVAMALNFGIGKKEGMEEAKRKLEWMAASSEQKASCGRLAVELNKGV